MAEAEKALERAKTAARQNLDAKLSARPPLDKAVTGTYEDLPWEAKVRVETGPADEHEVRLAAELATARARWLARAREGLDPFEG